MKVAVTGAGSFIGAALYRCLEGRRIGWTGVDVTPAPDRDAAPRLVADITQSGWWEELPEGIEAIVHLAAISRDADCRRDPARAFEVNLTGTVRVIEAAQARGIGQVIFASSEWVYGDVDAALKNEQTTIDAGSLSGEYALSKLAGERLLAMAHERTGLGVAVLRFGIVYGPRKHNWSAVEALHEAARSGDRIEVGSQATARRFIHVEDIAEGVAAALGRPGFGIYNLTGDRLVTLGEIIEASARAHGRSRTPQIWERTPGKASVRNIDNAKAKAELGWSPRIDLGAGLASLSAAGETAAVRA